MRTAFVRAMVMAALVSVPEPVTDAALPLGEICVYAGWRNLTGSTLGQGGPGIAGLVEASVEAVWTLQTPSTTPTPSARRTWVAGPPNPDEWRHRGDEVDVT